uniref:DUF5577 domain-containing protein n=1 Tax=Strigamia maritima TaxID=126957 RepID=T1IPT2_STRMM
MAASDNASTWLQFFKNAGLPPTVAANYAILFSNHRMQIDMLGDLSRDILQAMGITVMGDIIAVLKHAKDIDARNTREKTLGSVLGSPLISLQTKSQPASLRRVITESQRALVPPLKVKTTKPVQTRGKIISLKPKQVEEVPVKKVRRVLPQHEGPYQVKMPLGSTERTRRILAQQDQSTGTKHKKSSVFDRLGESNVTSTTEMDLPTSSTSTYGKTNSSVFARLGPSLDIPPCLEERQTGLVNVQIMLPNASDARKVIKSSSDKQSIGQRLGTVRLSSSTAHDEKPSMGVARRFIQQQSTSEGILANETYEKRNLPVHNRLTINRDSRTKIMKANDRSRMQFANKLKALGNF